MKYILYNVQYGMAPFALHTLTGIPSYDYRSDLVLLQINTTFLINLYVRHKVVLFYSQGLDFFYAFV